MKFSFRIELFMVVCLVFILGCTATDESGNPIGPAIDAIPDQELNEGESLSITILVRHPEKKSVVVSGVNLPEFALLNNEGRDGDDNQIFSIEFNPGYEDAGVYEIVLQALDTEGISDEITFSIEVFDTGCSKYGTALDLCDVADILPLIWGPGSNSIIIGGGLNYSTKVGVGWSQQYGGVFVTSYSIIGVNSDYITDTAKNVKIDGPEGSIIEIWDLETLEVINSNISNPGDQIVFTAMPNHRYGGYAWYADNSQQNLAIHATFE